MRNRDFRSDTVTQPSADMREAMMGAAVGDDVLDGDPTVRELEEFAADWLGKSGALFVPSGTMANQVAIGAWTRPGDEIVCERGSHVVCWEAGAASANHGVAIQTFRSRTGLIPAEELGGMFRPASEHCPDTVLVCVEQSFLGDGSGPGGRVLDRVNLEQIAELCGERGVPIHMDGARLANAAVASGREPAEWAAYADSVSICLSKGLGAPVGSIVAGDTDFLARGRLVRKRLGGWMRQAGFLAAAGLHALKHNVERLAVDHENARTLAYGLDALPGLSCSPEEVETNVVMVQVEAPELDAASLAARLAEDGVLAIPMSTRVLRFVTHLDVDADDVQAALESAASCLKLRSCENHG
jgi:threonine aldolase